MQLLVKYETTNHLKLVSVLVTQLVQDKSEHTAHHVAKEETTYIQCKRLCFHM